MKNEMLRGNCLSSRRQSQPTHSTNSDRQIHLMHSVLGIPRVNMILAFCELLSINSNSYIKDEHKIIEKHYCLLKTS